VTDPRTRRRKMRKGSGPVATAEAPHLRIIGDDLWQVVQEGMAARSTGRPERQRRAKHLLSGLGKCGVCGGGWVLTRDRYWGCGNVLYGNACSNRRLIAQKAYEERVLAELRGQMLAPDVVEAYLDEYRREHTRRSRELVRDRGQLERRKAEAARKVQRLVAAIAEGGGEFAEIRAALASAKDEEAAAERGLAAAEALPQIALHPGLARQYRTAIERLSEELADEATRRTAAPQLRKLIARIEVTPADGKRGVNLAVIRHIDEVLQLTRRTA
jgi:site-specific DNA recombinase